MLTSQVSVTTTRTALTAVSSTTRARSTTERKRAVVVKHTTTGSTVYLGGVDVTASGATGGWALGADDPLEIELDLSEDLYAITASGTVTVYVMSVG